MTSVRIESGVASIRFDDGGLNLLGVEGLRELHRALDEAEASAEIISFESGRPGLFAAGADMAEMLRFGSSDAEDFSALGQSLMNRIERSRILTIATVDGDCFGGALDLLMAFDLRIASPRSRFAHPGGRLGIVTGFGGTSRWRRVVSPRGGVRLFIENEVIDAEGALEHGLITHVAEEPHVYLEENMERWHERWRLFAPPLHQAIESLGNREIA